MPSTSNQPLRVLFIVPHPIEGPSSRFRIYQFTPYLEAHGIECTVRPFLNSDQIFALYRPGGTLKKIWLTLRGLGGRILDGIRAKKYDVVYILREGFALGPPVIERLLTRRAGCMIYDFDDAIYIKSLAYDNPIDRLRDFDKPEKVVALADGVVVGSEYLARYAREHASGAVTVAPTVVDHEVYKPHAKADPDSITIGWIGTPRGSHYVADMMPVFKRLYARHENVRFVFVGCAEFDPEGLPITFKDWALKDEPSDIAGFHIGIMPLTDDEETRGKCGFKLVQYMSSGVVPVGSPVGANCDIIQAGETGFLPDSEDEWFSTLDTLCGDAKLRQKIVKDARAYCIENYSLQATAPILEKAIKETFEKSRR